MLYVIKKDGTREEFNPQKIVAAVNKSGDAQHRGGGSGACESGSCQELP